jgi:hypothetical protein
MGLIVATSKLGSVDASDRAAVASAFCAEAVPAEVTRVTPPRHKRNKPRPVRRVGFMLKESPLIGCEGSLSKPTAEAGIPLAI